LKVYERKFFFASKNCSAGIAASVYKKALQIDGGIALLIFLDIQYKFQK